MDLSNLIMIAIVIIVLTSLLSKNLNLQEKKSNNSDSNLNSMEVIDNNVQNNHNFDNSNVVNSNVSGNNVNFSKESFESTNSNIIGSVESYSNGYQFNVDLVNNTVDKYHIELFNPKHKMFGVLHKEPNMNPIITTKDSTNINQHFQLVLLEDADVKDNLGISEGQEVFTIRKSTGEDTEIIHYDGQLSIQPLRIERLNTGHIFITREGKKNVGVSEYDINQSAEFDKTFNFDGTMSVTNYNNNLFRLVQNINRKVENLYRREQYNKDIVNESNTISNGSPIKITVSSEKEQFKSPFINARSSRKSIAEKFQEINNNNKNQELQQLVSETIASSSSEIKCPQLDEKKYIHVEDVDCLTCPKRKI